MKRLLLAAALALSLATPAFAQSAFPSDADLLAMIKSRVEDGRAAGIVLGVMDADGKTRVVSYGDPGPGAQPLSASSVFEIGSISKVFTSAILADMVAKNEVKLDVPAQTYAPAGMTLPKRSGPDGKDRQITLANLSEQNSGLPRLPTNLKMTDPANPYADYSVAQLNEFLAGYQLPRDIGAQFEYSNLGVGILGNLLANKAGKTYEALVTERVIKPLGMTMTGIKLTPAMQKQLAKGHDADGKVVGLWDIPTLAGAGAIRSNMTDMLKFLAANLAQPPKTQLQRDLAEAHKPRAEAGPNTEIGLNWLTMHRPGVDVVFHDGGTGGYGSLIAFDPKRRIGAVLLQNTSLPSSDIVLHLLDPTIPLQPKPKNPTERVAMDLSADIMERYAGVYALDAQPDFKLTIAVAGGKMTVQATGQNALPLYAETPTSFFAKALDVQITFPSTDGKPGYLALTQNGVSMKATRQP